MEPTNISVPPRSPRPPIKIVVRRRRRRPGTLFHARLLVRQITRLCGRGVELLIMGMVFFNMGIIWLTGTIIVILLAVAGVMALLHR
jgi:hypothetical protein